MTYAIEISNLNVFLNKKHILRNINLNIEKNTITAIIGPNGGGKTTLIKSIIGLQKSSSGTIKIFSKFTPLNFPKGLIGYLPQKIIYNIKFPAKVIDIVIMGRFPLLGVLKFPTKKDIKIAEKSLDKLNMLKYKNKYFQDLSGGLKQRVLIARSLSIEPKILILDEPSTGLDIITQQDFYNLLEELKKNGLTIIVVTHDIGIVSNYVDTLIGLNRKVHFYGTPADSLTLKNMEAIFGKDFSFVIHDKHCETCIYGNNKI